MTSSRATLFVLCASTLSMLVAPSAAHAAGECLLAGATRHFDGGAGVDQAWTTALNWDGDTLPAPGEVSCVPAGSAVSHVSGSAASARIVVEGTLRLGGGAIDAPDLQVGTDATVRQESGVNITTGSTFRNGGTWISPGQPLFGPGLFINEGTFVSRTGVGAAIDSRFDNHGTLRLDAGTSSAVLRLRGAGTHSGTFDIMGTGAAPRIAFSTATQAFNGATFASAADNGEHDLDTSVAFDDVRVDAPVSFRSGTATMSPTSLSSNSTGRQLHWRGSALAGTLVLPATWTMHQHVGLNLDTGTAVQNGGSWISPGQPLFGPGLFINDGTFVSRTGVGATIDSRFDNRGTVNLDAGTSSATLHLRGSGTHPGTFNILGIGVSPTIAFAGGTHVVDGGHLRSSAGRGRYASSGGTLQLSELASLRVDAPLALDSPMAASSASLTGTGTVSWSGSRLGAAGTLTVGPNVTLAPSGVASVGDKLVRTSGTVRLAPGTLLHRSTTGALDLRSGGRLVRAGTGAAAVVDMPVTTTADSTVSTVAGELSIQGSVNGSSTRLGPGTWIIAGGGTLRLGTVTSMNALGGVLVLRDSGSSIRSASGADLLAALADIEPAGGLLVGAGAAAVVPGPLLLRGMLLTGPGAIVDAGDVTIDVGGHLDASEGTVSLGAVRNAGVFDVGGRNVPVDGSFTQLGSGTLRLAFGADASGRAAVAGPATLDGSIVVDARLAGTSAPTPSSHQLLTYASASGRFASRSVVDAGHLKPFFLRFTETATSVGVQMVDPRPAAVSLVSSSAAVGTPTVARELQLAWRPQDPQSTLGYHVAIGTFSDLVPAGERRTTASAGFGALEPGRYFVAVRAVATDGTLGHVVRFGPFLLTDPLPADDGTPGGGTDPTRTSPPVDRTAPVIGRVASASLSKSRVIAVRFAACPRSEDACRGRLALHMRVPGRDGSPARTISLGSGAFTAVGGADSVVRVRVSHLSASQLRLLRSRPVTATITVRDASGNRGSARMALRLRSTR